MTWPRNLLSRFSEKGTFSKKIGYFLVKGNRPVNTTRYKYNMVLTFRHLAVNSRRCMCHRTLIRPTQCCTRSAGISPFLSWHLARPVGGVGYSDGALQVMRDLNIQLFHLRHMLLTRKRLPIVLCTSNDRRAKSSPLQRTPSLASSPQGTFFRYLNPISRLMTRRLLGRVDERDTVCNKAIHPNPLKQGVVVSAGYTGKNHLVRILLKVGRLLRK